MMSIIRDRRDAERIIFKEIEKRLREGRDTVIDGFGTFSVYRDGCTCTIVKFAPSKDLYERLDGEPKCPWCRSMDVVALLDRKHICRECETIWRE